MQPPQKNTLPSGRAPVLHGAGPLVLLPFPLGSLRPQSPEPHQKASHYMIPAILIWLDLESQIEVSEQCLARGVVGRQQ